MLLGLLVGRSCVGVQKTATGQQIATVRHCEANRQRTFGSRSDPRNCQPASLAGVLNTIYELLLPVFSVESLEDGGIDTDLCLFAEENWDEAR